MSQEYLLRCKSAIAIPLRSFNTFNTFESLTIINSVNSNDMFGACQELMHGLYMSYSEVTLVSKQCPTRETYTASCVTLVLCGKFLSPGPSCSKPD